MTVQQTLDYIHAYASHFKLHEHIQLRTRLREIQRIADEKQWRLSLVQGDREFNQDFDKVVLCTGRNHDAVMPEIKGRELFEGEVLHSQGFKRSEASQGALETCAEHTPEQKRSAERRFLLSALGVLQPIPAPSWWAMRRRYTCLIVGAT